ncbi:M4 family metallopeptidase [Myxococcus stipitatus]|uniref:M4 family metallopeptidase n=1 Tax=Myxococcus stipitatus TaxID=83455 RepID=UPI001F19952E|nr:M4 family metallopeptidase [Myxococcus stipitatus]MCE9666995.1 M4 family metallopeptidase [Myxococcus stipitatus]
MTIRRVDTKPVTARPANTAETKKNTAKTAPLSVKDGFGPAARTSELARAEKTLTQVPVTAGRLALTTPAAQQAIQTSLSHLNPLKGAQTLLPQAATFAATSVERDNIGMTHVRLNRVHEGVKVFGEQVVTHLDKDGKVSSVTGDQSTIPAGLGREQPKLSPQAAIDIARKDFAQKPDRQPTAERVIYQDKSGQYHSAYRVEVTNLTQVDETHRPRKQNYLIDANTGKVFESFNQIDGFFGSNKKLGRAADITASNTTPAEIKDKSTVTSKVTIDQDVEVDKLKLDLDINHTFKGDLKVTLTSPSGKSAVVHNRTGGSTDDIKGSFDLSQFAGEKAKGEWTLTVEDAAKLDTGKLNGWSLSVTPKETKPPEEPKPEGKVDDTSLYSGKVDLKTRQTADGKYVLEDSSRGKGVNTYDANNKSTASGKTQLTDDNDIWGEATDGSRTKAAVDAHYGAAMTYDFMKNVLGRDSIDGAGEALNSYVHVRTNYVNAFWDGEKMSYGDGDGVDSGPLTALDIAGHEIAHGLTERTAGLIYSGESGGLNEAFSDIMGAGVEWYASTQNPSVKFNWTVGETAWTPTNGDSEDGLRYMDDPTKDGYSIDHYKNYPKQTEVHGSSGIANNAFYLLANGGTNRTSKVEVKDGIGMEKGLKIYYRALAHYMTPKTTFAQAREATIKAATDLYGADSTEVKKVKESWTAVGVN